MMEASPTAHLEASLGEGADHPCCQDSVFSRHQERFVELSLHGQFRFGWGQSTLGLEEFRSCIANPREVQTQF